MNKQTFPIPLKVGTHVVVFDDVSVEPGGHIGSMVFEDKVARHIPETRKLEFEDSDVGYAEFERILEENDSVQIISG